MCVSHGNPITSLDDHCTVYSVLPCTWQYNNFIVQYYCTKRERLHACACSLYVMTTLPLASTTLTMAVQADGSDAHKDSSRLLKETDSRSLLSNAIREGNLDAVKALKKTGKCDPKGQDNEGNTQLHHACLYGKVNIVRYLIRQNCDPGVANKKRELPLHIACAQRSLEIVKLVSGRGVDCNATVTASISGDTPLHIACRSQQCEFARYLVEKRHCDPNIYNSNGELPLHVASELKSLEIVRIVSNCNVNARTCDGSTPLHRACRSQQHKIVRYLVEEKRCDPYICNSNGELPLHVASGLKSLEIVRIVSNCNVNARTRDGSTPLHRACRSQQHKIVRYLVEEKRCDPNICNVHGELPLHVASGLESLDIVAIVSDSICDMNATRHNGDTPLHIACRNGTPQIVQFLMTDKQCSLLLKNQLGELPQHIACGRESTEIVKVFSDNLVDTTTNSGDSSLHIACRDGSVEVVEYLIKEMQCDPSVRNPISGYLPLHHACRRNSLDIVKLVSKSDDVGGRLTIQSTLLDGPLFIAVAYSSLDIVRYLIDVKGYEVPNSCLAIACKYGNLGVVRYFTQEKHCSHSHTWAGSLPLHYASEHSLEMVKLVCDCDVNTRDDNGSGDSYGYTPLHNACNANKLDIVEYLVETKQCDTTIENCQKELPLHIACKKGSLDMVKLVSNNCDVNALSNEDTPLHVACEMGKLDIVEYLVETKHCLTTIENCRKERPLHIACKKGSLDMVKPVSNYCDVNAMSYEDTPLHVACEMGKLDIVEYLVETKQCDTTIENCRKELPLHIACKKGSLDMVKLVSNNCDVNAMSYEDTPLHVACEMGKLDIVEYLVETKQCDTTIENWQEELPLHIAWKKGSLDMVKLVSNNNPGLTATRSSHDTPRIACEMGKVDNVQYPIESAAVEVAIKGGRLDIVETITGSCDGNTELHVASMYASVATVRELIEKRHVDPSTPNDHGDTPLHLACREGREEVVSYLVNHCDPTNANNDGELPIHIACRTASLEVIQLVGGGGGIDLNKQTKFKGDTLLHVACREGRTDIVQYLACEEHCNPAIANYNGEFPLHIACTQKSLAMILLLSNCDVNTRTNQGNTPLHLAYREGVISIVKHLILDRHCDVSIANRDGELPLHLACREQNLEMVELLATNCQMCDLDIQTAQGNTPLHEACGAHKGWIQSRQKAKNIVQYLIKEHLCDPNLQNVSGKTPLHYACQFSATEVVEYLLSHGNADHSVKDLKEQTPLMFASEPQVIRVLLDHGADLSHLYKAYHDFFERHQSSGDPLPTPVRILVLGNASNGKTTLIESLKCEKGEDTQEVESHTAGIIPTNFESDVYGFVTLYDFAGQHEYYASHEAILHNVISSSPPVILLVVNISEPDEDIRRQLLYWLSFIENQRTLKAHLIVIGSHADLVCHCCDPPQRVEAMIQSFKSKLSTMPVGFSSSVAMDCREPTSCGINELRRQLKTSSDQLRDTTVMNFTCHCLYVFLLDKFRSQPAVTIGKVMSCDEMKEASSVLTDDEEDSDMEWSDYTGSTLSESSDDEAMDTVTSRDLLKILTRNSLSQVVKFCEELSSRSTIVFLKNCSDLSASLVILDREALMSKVQGTIFAPQGFKQYQCLATSTGVVPFSRLAAHFHDCDILASFLCHLEFCQEICDEKTLQLILEGETLAGSASERYFFFPGLISIDSPRQVWQQDGSYGYKSAWVLHCCQEGQYFTPRFLQVLILRLTFAFALPIHVPICGMPAFRRQCSLWKNGIRWFDMNGVETVVEVVEQTHVVHVMMQCYQGSEIQCVQHRSAVISKVLEAINEFCPRVAVVESFVHPSELNHYPLPRVEELTLFNVKSVAMTITSSGVSVVNEDGTKQVPFNKLLYFEPYSCMGRAILQKLYDPGDYNSRVSDDFICECARQVPSKLHDTFKQVFDPQVPPIQELVGVLQAWRDNSEGSYSCFREKLGEFSVLCGRNPLVGCHCLIFFMFCLFRELMSIHDIEIVYFGNELSWKLIW